MYWTEVINRQTGEVVSTSDFIGDYEQAKNQARSMGKSAYMAAHDAVFYSISDHVHLRGLGLDTDDVGLEKELNQASPLPKAPVLLIQWLAPNETQEVGAITDAFSQRTDIASVSAGTGEHGRNVVHAAILEWASGNDNCQFLYLSTHGDEESVGPVDDPGVAWSELWSWLVEANLEGIELWIGACVGSSVVPVWNNLLVSDTSRPVGAVVAFEDSPSTADLQLFITSILEQITSLSGTAMSLGGSVQVAANTIPDQTPQAFLLGKNSDGQPAFIQQA